MTFRKSSHFLRTHFDRRPRSHADGLSPRRLRAKRRDEKRRSLLESLETRQLLAGPDLIGIQPNEGDLLFSGDTLNFSPKELTFRFDDSTVIDESTLGAIRITRAGEDRVFESASVTSDLGTSGQGLFEFRARQSGSLGNGTSIVFLAEQRNTGPAPIISTSGNTITININVNPLQRTTASGLIFAINNDVRQSGDEPLRAGDVIEAIQVSGPSGQAIGVTDINNTTLVLDGANAAQAVTDFGTNGAVRVRLISQVPGVDGRAIRISVEQRNFGGTANPGGCRHRRNDPRPTEQFCWWPVDGTGLCRCSQTAIHKRRPWFRHRCKRAWAIHRLGTSAPATRQFHSAVSATSWSNRGLSALGDSPREVIFRFAEPLPDDFYQIDILGTGNFALLNEDGEAFNDGEDLTRTFSINLGPQVVAVVPEPVRRRSDGTFSTETGKIEVHFNDDDLVEAKAENPDFYQLIFTRDTVDNTDDVIVPLDAGAVQYDNITNIATLDYKRPLSRIPDPGQSRTTAQWQRTVADWHQ